MMLVAGALMLTPRLGRGYVECEVFFLFCFRNQTRVSLMLTASFAIFPQPDYLLTWYFPGLPSFPRTESRVGGGSGGSESREGELRLIMGMFTLRLSVTILNHVYTVSAVCSWWILMFQSFPWFLCPDGHRWLPPLHISCHKVTKTMTVIAVETLENLK